MTDFLLCIGRYVVEMAVLALIGGLGSKDLLLNNQLIGHFY